MKVDFRRGNVPEIIQIPKIFEMGTRDGPDLLKLRKIMVWSLQNLEKQHPKPAENLENAAPQIPRNLDLARWRVMRAAHCIHISLYIYIYI